MTMMTTKKRVSYSVEPAAGDAAIEELLTLLSPVFHAPLDWMPKFREAVGDANFRAIKGDGQLVGGLALVPMGQFFGGRSVSMVGIVTVGIAPHFRARGAASALMNETLKEMHRDKRFALSTLYPATVPVYRRAGYEFAGSRYMIEIELPHIDVRDYEYDMRPMLESDYDAVEQCYREYASWNNGLLDRGDYIWRRIRKPRNVQPHAYVVLDGDAVRGSVHFQVKQRDNEEYLFLWDIVALDAKAGRRLLTFLADHRSMEQKVIWAGGPIPPYIAMLREQFAEMTLREQWMTRIIDVERAITERGYLPGIDTEVHFDVHDDLIDANTDRFVLRVSNGSAEVERGGNGDITIGIRGLAALYTGHRTLHELIAADMAHAADDEAALRATAAFAGPKPWLGDMF